MSLFIPTSLLGALRLLDLNDDGSVGWPAVAALLLVRLCLDPHPPPAFRLLSSCAAAAFRRGGSGRVSDGQLYGASIDRRDEKGPESTAKELGSVRKAHREKMERVWGFFDVLPVTAFICGFMSMIWWAVCDISAQYFIWGTLHNTQRIVVRCCFGLFYHGPSFHYYFNTMGLDSSRAAAAAKALLDHFLCYPLFTTIFEHFAFGKTYDCFSFDDIPLSDRYDFLLADHRCLVTSLALAAIIVVFYPQKEDLHVLFAHDLWIAFYCFTQIC